MVGDGELSERLAVSASFSICDWRRECVCVCEGGVFHSLFHDATILIFIRDLFSIKWGKKREKKDASAVWRFFVWGGGHLQSHKVDFQDLFFSFELKDG